MPRHSPPFGCGSAVLWGLGFAAGSLLIALVVTPHPSDAQTEAVGAPTAGSAGGAAGAIAPTPAAPEEAPPAETAARGSRDPFRPFNLDLQERPEPPKTPLEQYDLASLTLVAVIWNVSDPKAMVEDDTGLGYTIGVGTPIGRSGGVVRKIEPDQVTVEEEYLDFYGEKQKTERVLKLKPEGEKKP